MKKKDLAVGDRVYVHVPYSGGEGWAEILDLNSDPGYRKSWTVLVRFDPSQTAYGERRIPVSHVARKWVP